jgi:DNA-binding transcriptional regulator YhcF (GntR family)
MQGLSTVARELREARIERDIERRDELSRENRGFVQVYPKGWSRLQHLIRTNPSAARLYALLAENMDPQGGVVVAAQTVLAEILDVNERTIRRLTQALEDQNAIVRIRVGSGTYAYALDPSEVWKAWDVAKDHAVFRTKTLVSKNGENALVKRRLQVMIREQMGEPELPGLDYDPETGEVLNPGSGS